MKMAAPTPDNDAPPPGFTLDGPGDAPPPGFTLDGPGDAQPPGFTLDEAKRPKGFLSSAASAIGDQWRSGMDALRSGAEGMTGQTIPSLGNVGKVLLGGVEAAGAIPGGIAKAAVDPYRQLVTAGGDAIGAPAGLTRFASNMVGTPLEMAASGGIGAAGPAAVGNVARAASSLISGAKPIEKAAPEILTHSRQDAAGGISEESVDKAASRARSLGVPVGVGDTGGPNVRGLLKHAMRAPGESMAVARTILNERDAAAPDRLLTKNQQFLGTGSTYEVSQELLDARSKAAAPLYAKIRNTSDFVPVRQQATASYTQAAADHKAAADSIPGLTDKVQALRQKTLRTSPAASPQTREKIAADLKAAEEDMTAAEGRLAQSQSDMAMAQAVMKRAAADAAAGKTGGVYDPHIMRMIHESASGPGLLQRGRRIEKDTAAAENRPAMQTELAITGKDEHGVDAVGDVPTVSHLLVFKEGLDAKIDAMITKNNGLVSKDVRPLLDMKRALIEKMDKLIPGYKAARDVWAGPSAARTAMLWGRDGVFKQAPEENAALFQAMGKTEQDFARLGLAEHMRKLILDSKMNQDEAKRIFQTPWVRAQVKPLFRSDSDFNDYMDAISAERGMFDTGVTRSDTTENLLRATEEARQGTDDVMKFANGMVQLKSMDLLGAARSFMDWSKTRGLRSDPEVNTIIARLLLDPEMFLRPAADKATSRAISDIPGIAKAARAATPKVGPGGRQVGAGVSAVGSQLAPVLNSIYGDTSQ